MRDFVYPSFLFSNLIFCALNVTVGNYGMAVLNGGAFLLLLTVRD